MTPVDAIRARHENARPDATVNPAWANAEVDIGLLLEEYDALVLISNTNAMEATSAQAALIRIESMGGLGAGPDATLCSQIAREVLGWP